MTEETFRLVVAIAAVSIVVIFLINVVAWGVLAYVALTLKKMVVDFIAKVEPQIPKIQATLTDVQQTVAHVTETTNQLTTEVKAVSAAVTVSAERVSVIATESAEEIRALVTQASADIKAMVGTTSHEVTDLVIKSSSQVRGVMSASSDTANGSLERIDLLVERTVDRVEETGAYVQDSVLTPIREVGAIVTGIKVALETLLGYPERKQIDQAYMDEELFI